LSRVFDARKHAEESKRARDAVAGSEKPAEAEAPQSPEPAIESADPGPRTERDKAAQRGPLVRSLLRMPRLGPRGAGGGGVTANTFGNLGKAGGSRPAMLILPEDPLYPEIAREQQISGSVEVQFRISPEGKVYDVKSVGLPLLARAAIEAVEARSYEPARLNGAPIDSQASTSFVFRLS
jgi:TonB family protein